VTSTPTRGSTFTVFVPSRASATVAREEPGLVRIEEKPDRFRTKGLEGRALAGKKVLLVDDDFRNIFALTALLERGSADVSVAESGADAIATLDQNRDIDIVLMDIMMPVMDGYDTIRAIRRFPHFKALPIIAVTGKVVPGERDRCIDAGANDYVPKPVDTAELLAALGPWLPTPAASSA
jgi:CheY-like chemotaxis protein